MDEYRIPRERMVERLRGHYKIRDEKILNVMRDIPRHFFVPEALKANAYGDHALPILSGQTISQPYIVARMTELLELSHQSRVLEIGAGSGYQTVILSKLARTVYAIERQPDLVKDTSKRLQSLQLSNVTLRLADGTIGLDVYAPYDAILIAAASPNVPEPLRNQLKIGGKLVIPIGKSGASQKLVRVTRREKDFLTEEFGNCSFVPLIGEHGWQE